MTNLALASAPTQAPWLLTRFILELASAFGTVSIAHETSPPLSAFSAQPESVNDGWFRETLGRIEHYRHYGEGWDGRNAPAPNPESLVSTEYLTALFSDWPSIQRPKLGLDMDGVPTFAAKADDFYLHVKVESPALLTWFAVVNGIEYFEDDVPFDGSSLPDALADLIR